MKVALNCNICTVAFEKDIDINALIGSLDNNNPREVILSAKCPKCRCKHRYAADEVNPVKETALR